MQFGYDVMVIDFSTHFVFFRFIVSMGIIILNKSRYFTPYQGKF
jgi:hypothetical protein